MKGARRKNAPYLAAPDRPICGAKTRRGTVCGRTVLYSNGRCYHHGGPSTGPKTPEGIAKVTRVIEAVNARARARALARLGIEPVTETDVSVTETGADGGSAEVGVGVMGPAAPMSPSTPPGGDLSSGDPPSKNPPCTGPAREQDPEDAGEEQERGPGR